eukprot:TRINITY_DN59802_c0_g1_i1.p1 TRINITY_DN59802_c0_g1~~TRINITY_DN59802_c0_g1_i1.p1  ORF type:complete len:458 (+),score=162.25 TRINITY_DN59802_c0_g1_i1:78-1451(+)
MDITAICTATGKHVNLEVEEEETVGELKDRLAEILGVSENEEGEMHAGRRLKMRIRGEGEAPEITDNDAEVQYAGIKDGDELEVGLRSLLCPHEYTGHSGGVGCLLLTPCGTRLYTVGLDVKLRVWNTETGKCIATRSCDYFKQMAISPQGDRLYTSDMLLLLVWDTDTWESRVIEEEPPRAIALSPEGEKLYVSTDVLRIWDTESWEFHEVLPAQGRVFTALVVSQCGKRLFAANPDPEEIVMLCTETFNILRVASTRQEVRQLLLSPCGAYLYSRSHKFGEVRKWDTDAILPAGEGIFDCGLLPDMTESDSVNAVVVWDISLSSCGRWLFCIGHGIAVWDAKTFECKGMVSRGSFGTAVVAWGDYIFHNMGKKVNVVKYGSLEDILVMHPEGVDNADDNSDEGAALYTLKMTNNNQRLTGTVEEFRTHEQWHIPTMEDRDREEAERKKKEGCVIC